jgi:large subunit ribosomal protein L6
MSRIGKRPVTIPSGVSARSRCGVRSRARRASWNPRVEGTTVVVEGGEVRVSAEKLTRKPAFGTMRAHVQNMVLGVTAGFSKTLEIVGTGYRAAMDGKKLVLQLGFSHPIHFDPPAGITIKVENPTRIVISGADKWQVGQVSADIRAYRPPEPYKGKGVKYEGEYIRRKAGKAAGTAAS